MSMRVSPETPITMQELFAIKPANSIEPIRCLVSDLKVAGEFQKVSLTPIAPPRTCFEMSTSRLVAPGVYSSRDERYLYLRLLALDFDRLGHHFPGISTSDLMKMLIGEVRSSNLVTPIG